MLRNFNGWEQRGKRKDSIIHLLDYIVFFLFLMFVFLVVQDYNRPDDINNEEQGFYTIKEK